MYRCKVCTQVSKVGQKRQIHVLHRTVTKAKQLDEKIPRQEIAAEVPLCDECVAELKRGKSFTDLLAERGVFTKPPSFIFTVRPKQGPIGRSALRR
jgi:hypothetical protein